MPALIFMHCVVYMVKHVGKRIYWNKSVEEDMTILCVRCRLHLSQQGGETDWRFHLREAFYGLFYKYLEVVNLVLLLTKDFHCGSQLFQDSCFEAIKFKTWCFWVFLGLETQGAHNFLMRQINPVITTNHLIFIIFTYVPKHLFSLSNFNKCLTTKLFLAI